MDAQIKTRNIIEAKIIRADGTVEDLTGGAAVLTYQKRGGTAVNVAGVISTSTVTVSFAHATTQLMSGAYHFQLMCRNTTNQIVMTREGEIRVRQSLNPDAVAV